MFGIVQDKNNIFPTSFLTQLSNDVALNINNNIIFMEINENVPQYIYVTENITLNVFRV